MRRIKTDFSSESEIALHSTPFPGGHPEDNLFPCVSCAFPQIDSLLRVQPSYLNTSLVNSERKQDKGRRKGSLLRLLRDLMSRILLHILPILLRIRGGPKIRIPLGRIRSSITWSRVHLFAQARTTLQAGLSVVPRDQCIRARLLWPAGPTKPNGVPFVYELILGRRPRTDLVLRLPSSSTSAAADADGAAAAAAKRQRVEFDGLVRETDPAAF